MTKYRLKIGGEPIHFHSTSPQGFIDAWRDASPYHWEDDTQWMRNAAALACDWSGKPVRYDTLENFTQDMMRHGLLEEVSA